MLHSYFLYPVFLFFLLKIRRNKKNHSFFLEEELPPIAIICAAYNEEKVIVQKIESTFNTTYPNKKIKMYIGTDACTDGTVALIKQQQARFPQIELLECRQRTGKINIINMLSDKATEPVFIMTDANVFFSEKTLLELVKPLKKETIKIVCGNIQKRALNQETSVQNELHYFSYENFLKHAESICWSLVIGVEGGCYAIKKTAFYPVPPTFVVDDFFVAAQVLSCGEEILFAADALAYEDVFAKTNEEYKRKVRIATGNFQNLFYFKKMLNPFSALGFAYYSHKVLRWFTPFLFLLNFVCAAFLLSKHIFFIWIFLLELIGLFVPVLFLLFQKMNIKIALLHSLNHFILMNAALVVGFFRYCKGVKNSVWQPLSR